MDPMYMMGPTDPLDEPYETRISCPEGWCESSNEVDKYGGLCVYGTMVLNTVDWEDCQRKVCGEEAWDQSFSSCNVVVFDDWASVGGGDNMCESYTCSPNAYNAVPFTKREPNDHTTLKWRDTT